MSSDADDARTAAAKLAARYGQCSVAEADVVVALGGDGFLLHTLRETMDTGKPIYGMNRGTIGFPHERIPRGRPACAHRGGAARDDPPAGNAGDDRRRARLSPALAINEVALWRQSYQTAKIRITIDGQVRLDELYCDGVMVATPAGSTAYNLSAQGPILPLDAPLLALTPVSPFRPRRWRGALLSNQRDGALRHPRTRQAAGQRGRRPHRGQGGRLVTVRESPTATATLLFDPSHSWNERILAEQFRY